MTGNIILKDFDYENDVEEVYSQRNYTVYEVAAALIDDPKSVEECNDGYSTTRECKEATTLRLYVDDLTGVITTDIEKYEASLGERV